MAAGCSFDEEKLQMVADALHEYAGTCLTPDDFLPEVTADIEVEPGEITLAATEALQLMEPFGCENPEPSFLAKKVTLSQVIPTKNPCHARLLLRHEEQAAAAGVAFNIGERVMEIGAGAVTEMLFHPTLNEWRGSTEMKWQVRDLRPVEG